MNIHPVIIGFCLLVQCTTIIDSSKNQIRQELGSRSFVMTNYCKEELSRELNNSATVSCLCQSSDVSMILRSLPGSVINLTLILYANYKGNFPFPPYSTDLRNTSHLTSLESLAVTTDGSVGYRNYLKLENDTFLSLKNLKRLRINVPLYEQELQVGFEHFKKQLVELDLSDTTALGLREVLTILPRINTSAIEKLKLRNFQTIGYEGYSSYVNMSLLFGGNHSAPNLKHLDLSHNGFGVVYPSLIWTFPNLIYLDLSNNFLVLAVNNAFFFEFVLHPHLQEVNMENQGEINESPTLIRSTGGLHDLLRHQHHHHHHSHLDSFSAVLLHIINQDSGGNISDTMYDNAFMCQTIYSLAEVIAKPDLADLIKKIPCSAFGVWADVIDLNCTFFIKFPFFKNLKRVMISGLNYYHRFGYKISGRICFTETPLQEISFGNNGQWTNSVFVAKSLNQVSLHGINNLETIDLQNDQLHLQIARTEVTYRKLRNLIYTGNYLSLGNSSLCEHFPHVRNVLFGTNNLSTLPGHLFKECSLLETIDLSNNKLGESFGMELPQQNTIRLLNLSHNSFQIIPKHLQTYLDHISVTSNLTLDISKNRFTCTCNKEALQFLAWYQKTSVNIVAKNKLVCLGNDGESRINDVDVQSLYIECFPSYELVIIRSVCSTLSAVAFGCLIALTYHYRWRIRYKIFQIKKKASSFLQDNEDHPDRKVWKYDAFVSYCADDRFWVHDVLMKQLEDVYGFKLCIHYRDFMLGEAIVDEISRAITQSSRLIVVVSEVSQKRPWCDLELKIALNEAINRRTQIIIVKMWVGHFQVQYQNIARALETQVCLEWIENNEDGKKMFWAKLVAELYGNPQGTSCCCTYGQKAIGAETIRRAYSYDTEVDGDSMALISNGHMQTDEY